MIQQSNETICILLSTYNGAFYLKEQLSSLEKQSYTNIHLFIRDDGSNDLTCKILETFQTETHLRLTRLQSEKNLGALKSFEALLEHVVNHTDYEYIMFCDQDDIWKSDKVAQSLNAMQGLSQKNSDTPLLIHTDLSVADEDLHVINASFWNYENIDPSKNSLNRLLLQNTVTGCTMMINRKLAKMALPIPKNCIMHDWWIALVAAGFGKITYINQSTLLYRQHQENSIGTNDYNRVSIFYKIFKLLSAQNESYLNHLKENFDQANIFLHQYETFFDSDTKKMIQAYCHLKDVSFIKKRFLIIKYHFFKHKLSQNISMLIRI